ncbi:MAG: LPS export ABC transporter periplasmic protein LptC, partial [Bdellovibrionaceae bacterium]|nr:LPS export ABC transporter periplasmic protein LptC [Pseudobdellovibrionaceae bacterium]
VNKIVFGVAIIVFIIFQWYYFSVSSSPTTGASGEASQADTAQTKTDEAQKMTNFFLVDSEGSKKEFELWATEAQKAMGASNWKMKDVKVQFYTASAVYTVYGTRGTVNEEKNSMIIEGDVRMNSSNGYHFYTDRLDYNAEIKEITTDSKISLEGPKEKEGRLYLEGVGLYVDLQKSFMRIKNNVSGYKPMSQNRVMKISSQLGEFSGLNKSALFKNNVLISVDDMRVRGNFAKFQYKDDKLDTLFMDGGIHLQDANKTGTAGEALVYFNEDKYVFRKKPFMTQSENELIGDEVTVFDGGKRVQVKNAKVEYFESDKSKEAEKK